MILVAYILLECILQLMHIISTESCIAFYCFFSFLLTLSCLVLTSLILKVFVRVFRLTFFCIYYFPISVCVIQTIFSFV